MRTVIGGHRFVVDRLGEVWDDVFMLKDGFLICAICGQMMTGSGIIQETLVGYSSPPGHDHNDNCMSQEYVCPSGHRATVSIRRKCPKCDWVGKESCFCHKGTKLDKWPLSPK